MADQRWGASHTKALKDLFQSGAADPMRLGDSEYIDLIHDDAEPALKNYPKERFRHHYREKARTFMTGQAAQGIRLKAFVAKTAAATEAKAESKKEEASTIDEDNDEEVGVKDEEVSKENDIEEEDSKPPATTLASVMPTTAQKKPPPGTDVVGNLFPGCHFDLTKEVPYYPMFLTHPYESLNHDRIYATIVPPACFDGTGYSAEVVEDGMEFRLGFDTISSLTDPHDVHHYLSATYGRPFSSEDSSKAKSWTKAGKALRKKQHVFRMRLGFQCQSTFADDLDNPGIDFIEITGKDDEGNDKVVPLLLMELKSAKRIETIDQKKAKTLKKKNFKSPEKVKGVKGATSDYAKLLQKMIEEGHDITALTKQAKRGRNNEDAMSDEIVEG